MKTLAIIGCSGMVREFVYDYMKNLAVRLVAICDTRENMERFAATYTTPARYEDYRELLEREHPELVLLFPAEESLQFEMAEASLLAGADVLCERPVCHSAAEGERLAALQRQTGRFIMPRYNRRYMPAYATARKILTDGRFGQPYMYQSTFHAGAYGSEKSFVENHVSHHLDLARMLLGEIELLYVKKHVEDDTRVGYHIVFEGQNGLVGAIHSNSFLCGDYPMERVEISGDRRQIIVENVRHLWYNEPAVKIDGTDADDFSVPGGTRILNRNNAQLNEFAYYGFEQMVRDFVRYAESGTKPIQDMEDTLKTFLLVQQLRAGKNTV